VVSAYSHSNFPHAWSVTLGKVVHGVGNLTLMSIDVAPGFECPDLTFAVSKVTAGNEVNKAMVDSLLEFSRQLLGSVGLRKPGPLELVLIKVTI